VEKEIKPIEKIPPKEILIGFYNGHLKGYLAAAIRLRAAKAADPNEVVGTREIPPLGPNQLPNTVDIKAKEMIPVEEKALRIQRGFLLSVEEGLKLIEKDPTPWRKNTQK
jgi:hypothetical protein|tara:strand:+ start:1269 stop:1598 length:330 start_codon:yes stop_codon:yes gene_type:complete